MISRRRALSPSRGREGGSQGRRCERASHPAWRQAGRGSSRSSIFGRFHRSRLRPTDDARKATTRCRVGVPRHVRDDHCSFCQFGCPSPSCSLRAIYPCSAVAVCPSGTCGGWRMPRRAGGRAGGGVSMIIITSTISRSSLPPSILPPSRIAPSVRVRPQAAPSDESAPHPRSRPPSLPPLIRCGHNLHHPWLALI